MDRPYCNRCKDELKPGVITRYNEYTTDHKEYVKCGCRYTPKEMGIPRYAWNNDKYPIFKEVDRSVIVGLQKYIKDFKIYDANPNVRLSNKKIGLFLSSVQGSGKTYLTTYVLQKLAYEFGVKSYYITAYDFLEIGKSWDAGDKEMVEFLHDIELLAIDDIAAAQMTERADAIMTKLIDYRYRECKPMILAADKSLDQIEKIMFTSEGAASRICSRITEFCEIISLGDISFRV